MNIQTLGSHLFAATMLFFAIAFGQSGIDKVVDWKGNLEWLQGHFAQSPLKNLVPMLLAKLTFFELVTALMCLGGCYGVYKQEFAALAIYAVLACLATLLMLFFGQRVAKDYVGASTIAIYFGVAILGGIALAIALPDLPLQT